MGANRRFFSLTEDSSFFEFKIDTRNVTIGATDGDQYDNTFFMPFGVSTNVLGSVLQVSDGRPDIILDTTTINHLKNNPLLFANPGIYTVRIVGIAYLLTFLKSKLKLIEVSAFGRRTSFHVSCFYLCKNLLIKAADAPYLTSNQTQLFRGIKGFSEDVILSSWDFSRVHSAAYMFYQVQLPMNSIPQGFLELVSMDRLYEAAPISNLNKIEIISTTVKSAQWLFFQTAFQGRLIMKTPNLVNITAIAYMGNPIPLGEVDIRSVTVATNFIYVPMSQNRVDSTLTGWVNNFDWSNTPAVPNKVTFDFKNSKYSNNAAVIAAKAFLESKGLVFTNLTMT